MAPSPTPKTKSDELLDRLNELYRRDNPPTTFELRQLKREAKAVVQAEPSWGWVLQGMIAVLEGDPVEMKRCHEIAINIAPHNGELYRNFAVSLTKMGFIGEAFQQMRTAYKFEEGNLETLDMLVEYAWDAGRVHEALSYCEAWELINPGHIQEFKKALVIASRVFDAVALTDDDAEHVIALAEDVLHDKGIYHLQTIKGVNADEDSAWCYWTFAIPRSVEEVVGLDMDLIESLVESDVSSMVGEHIVVRYQAGGRNGSRHRRTSSPSEATSC